MLKKITIYLVAFILIWVVRVQTIKSFVLVDAIFVFVLSIPIILILVSLEYSDREKIKLKNLKEQETLDPQIRTANLPDILSYQTNSKTFLLISIICFLLIQMISISNWIIVMAAGKNSLGYLIGWGFGVILFIIWLIIYAFKGSKIILTKEKLKITELNYFLQTKNFEIDNSKIKEFNKFCIQSNLQARPKQAYKLGFWTVNKEFIAFGPNFVQSKYQAEKIMSDLELFKQKNGLDFVVKNQNFESQMSNYFKNNMRNAFMVTSLILFYLFLPLFTSLLFN